jgi:hypothetical protein
MMWTDFIDPQVLRSIDPQILKSSNPQILKFYWTPITVTDIPSFPGLTIAVNRRGLV